MMELAAYARYKRVAEWYAVDPEFRQLMEEDPAQALARLGYELDPELARDGARALATSSFHSERYASNPFVQSFCEINKNASEFVARVHGPEGFASKELYAFEDTQRNRCRMESHLIRAHSNVYYFPIAFELSAGCSVQCPFCGLAAPRFSGNFAYTEENARLWREALAAVREMLGPIAGMSLCFFATEPLDNPHYERFMADFLQVTGMISQTTTAVADRYPERIRALIELYGQERLAREDGLRVTVRTLSQFKRMAKEFTPEEFAFVEVLPNNPESLYRYSDSGRAHGGAATGKKGVCYSICCVAGARVNMLRRTIEFIEPQLPGKRYPLGYRVRETRSFDDARSFREALADLFARHAVGLMPRGLPLQLNEHASLEKEDGCLVLGGDMVNLRMTSDVLLEKCLTLMLEDGATFDDAVCNLGAFGAIANSLYNRLNKMYVRGYLVIP